MNNYKFCTVIKEIKSQHDVHSCTECLPTLLVCLTKMVTWLDMCPYEKEKLFCCLNTYILYILIIIARSEA